MIALTLIALVWLFACLMAVALCAMARRGDLALAAHPHDVVAVEDTPFVFDFATPVAPEPVAALRDRAGRPLAR
jgi:hypothetical protein